MTAPTDPDRSPAAASSPGARPCTGPARRRIGPGRHRPLHPLPACRVRKPSTPTWLWPRRRASATPASSCAARAGDRRWPPWARPGSMRCAWARSARRRGHSCGPCPGPSPRRPRPDRSGPRARRRRAAPDLAPRAPWSSPSTTRCPSRAGARAAADQARRWRAADALVHPRRGAACVSSKPAPRACPSTSSPSTCRFGGPAPPAGPRPGPGSGLDDGPTALLLGQVRAYKGIGLLAQAWPQVAAAAPRGQAPRGGGGLRVG